MFEKKIHIYLNSEKNKQISVGIVSGTYEELLKNKSEFLSENDLTSTSEEKKFEFLLSRRSTFIASDGDKLQLRYGSLGYPIISSTTHDLSLSHSKNFSASALFPKELCVGIDTESLDRDISDAFINRMLDGSESYQNKKLYALVTWTAKEALSKALRCGLTMPLTFLNIKEITEKDNLLIGKFKHFYEFSFVSFIVEEFNQIITVAFSATCDDLKLQYNHKISD